MIPKKQYKIGEVMKYSGLSRQVIHNYTMMGLIVAEERTSAGHRLYPEDVFERLKKVERFKAHRSLCEVAEMLRKEDEEARAKA
jgi:DNA-binding transcriptional MerR regulator